VSAAEHSVRPSSRERKAKKVKEGETRRNAISVETNDLDLKRKRLEGHEKRGGRRTRK